MKKNSALISTLIVSVLFFLVLNQRDRAWQYSENMAQLVEAIENGAEPLENGIYYIPISEDETLMAVPLPEKNKKGEIFTFSIFKNKQKKACLATEEAL